MNGRDAMAWAQEAIRNAAPHQPVEALRVHWVPERAEFEVEARPVAADGTPGTWTTHQGDRDDLADLLDRARSIVTGG